MDKVYYPGFKTHPNHKIAKKQMRMFGAMVSFDLKGGNMTDATTVLTGTHLFSLAESLGGVESLIGHPASMTHASIPRESRLAVGFKTHSHSRTHSLFNKNKKNYVFCCGYVLN